MEHIQVGDVRGPRGLLSQQEYVMLALDGLRPDVGHEVLWILRDGISGEILLARPLLSECEADLAALITEVQANCLCRSAE